MGFLNGKRNFRVVITIIAAIIFLFIPKEAFAEGDQPTKSTVNYYDPTDSQNHEKTKEGCISLTASLTEWEDGKWYVLDSDVTFSKTIIVKGNVNLILADGKTLNAQKGILTKGKDLTVWAQSMCSEMGSLIAAGTDNLPGIKAGGTYTENITLWENDGSIGYSSWNSLYRFGDERSSSEECLFIFDEDDWNLIKTKDVWINFEMNPPYNVYIKLTTGWWSTDYNGSNYNLYGDAQTDEDGKCWVKINFAEEGVMIDFIDQQDILFSGEGYKILGIYADKETTAESGTITINGGSVTATGGSGADGIYCYDSFIVNGGIVKSTKGSDGKAIYTKTDSLSLAGMCVYTSENASNPVLASERENSCTGDFVKIIPCSNHVYSDGVCKWCGASEPALIKFKVTFKVVNGSWNDGTKGNKVVNLSKWDYEDKLLVLTDEDIPGVGKRPFKGYKAGSWDVTPNTEKSVSKDLVYTYTYAVADKENKKENVSFHEEDFDYLRPLREALASAKVRGGEQNVYWSEGDALPHDIMKTLEDNPDITLVFSYFYKGKYYSVKIPGKVAKADIKIPWYGPLYLFGMYGSFK